ncbi:uncharacterized protein METZ01_LOCUS303945, partial [marine metagenome]
VPRLIDALSGAGAHRGQDVPARAIDTGKTENLHRNTVRASKIKPRLLGS